MYAACRTSLLIPNSAHKKALDNSAINSSVRNRASQTGSSDPGRDGTCALTKLLETGRVEGIGILKAFKGRHRDKIAPRRIVRLAVAFEKTSPRDCNERLRIRVAMVLIDRRRVPTQTTLGEATA